MKKIVIFGSGDHAKVVLTEILNLKKFKVAGFIDDKKKVGETLFKYLGKEYKNIDSLKSFAKKTKDQTISGIIGIGSNYLRKKIFNKVNKINKFFDWETIVSKNAVLNGEVKIGKGTIIMSGVTINHGSIIKSNCIINTSSSIDHHNLFNDFSSCGPGTVTGGNVKIGQESHLGIGSNI